MATLKELRAAKAKAQMDLRAAEGRLARIDADLTVVRNQLQELRGQLASGARAQLAARVDELESALERAEEDRERARDALNDATTTEQEFITEAAESAATSAPSLNDALGVLQHTLDEAQTDAVRQWAMTALGIARAAIALQAEPTHAAFAGRSVKEHLSEALKAHLELLKSILGSATSVTLGGELLVPDDAAIQDRGISHGGLDRLHWETQAVFQGRRGTAYVELYLTREARR